MGNARVAVVTCISFFLLKRKSVLAMDKRTHAACLRLGRWREVP